MFKCKRAGIYQVQAFALSGHRTGFFLEILKNNRAVATLYANGNHSVGSAGNTVILRLESEDTVKVNIKGTHGAVFPLSHHSTTFTCVELGSLMLGKVLHRTDIFILKSSKSPLQANEISSLSCGETSFVCVVLICMCQPKRI